MLSLLEHLEADDRLGLLDVVFWPHKHVVLLLGDHQALLLLILVVDGQLAFHVPDLSLNIFLPRALFLEPLFVPLNFEI